MDLNGLIEAMATGYATAGGAWQRAMAMGADPGVVIRGIRSHMDGADGVTLAAVEDMLNQVGAAVGIGVGDDQCEHIRSPTISTIKRLLAEAPAPLPNQAPAIECGVMLPSGAQFMGSLSETPEGGLRMLSAAPPQQQTKRGVVQMLEQFFDHSDVMVIALRREVALESAGIIIGS